MSTATITPLSPGAVVELHGLTSKFDSLNAAIAYCRERGAVPHLLRFPSIPLKTAVQILAISPGLQGEDVAPNVGGE